MTKEKDIEKLSFEESLKELEGIVGSFESGGMNLDKSIAGYTRGIALKKHCEKKLQEAKLTVEKITSAPDGSMSSEPVEL